MNKLIRILAVFILITIFLPKPQITNAKGAVGIPTREQFYKNEEIKKRKDREELTAKMSRSNERVLDVPVYFQKNNYYCGPAVAQMTLKYVANRYIEQDTFARDMGTTEGNGTYIYSLASDINSYRGIDNYYVVRHTKERNFFESLQKTINDNHPVIILLNHPPKFHKNYPSEDGHFIIARGYSNINGVKKVHFIDPFEGAPTPGKGTTELINIINGMEHEESGRGFFIY